MERDAEVIKARIPDWAWPQILDLLDESIRMNEDMYEQIARHVRA